MSREFSSTPHLVYTSFLPSILEGGWVWLEPAFVSLSQLPSLGPSTALRVNINGGMTPGSPSEGMVLPPQDRSWCPSWTQHLCAKGHLGASHLLLLLPCFWCALGCSAKQLFCKHSRWAEVPLPHLVNLSHSRREQDWSIHFCSNVHLWRGTQEL